MNIKKLLISSCLITAISAYGVTFPPNTSPDPNQANEDLTIDYTNMPAQYTLLITSKGNFNTTNMNESSSIYELNTFSSSLPDFWVSMSVINKFDTSESYQFQLRYWGGYDGGDYSRYVNFANFSSNLEVTTDDSDKSIMCAANNNFCFRIDGGGSGPNYWAEFLHITNNPNFNPNTMTKNKNIKKESLLTNVLNMVKAWF